MIGSDLHDAILRLVNGIISEYFIPSNLQMSNITTIYKKKGSKHDLDNGRGILSFSVFKKIIDLQRKVSTPRPVHVRLQYRGKEEEKY